MALPLWTHYMIGGHLSSDDGGKYTYAATLLALVFPILAFLRNSIMNGIIIRGMLEFLLILVGSLILSIIINFTNYTYTDLMTCGVRITALVMFVTLITAIEMNVQAHRMLRMILLTISCSLALLFVFGSIVTPVWHWGRFAPNDMQPNWWGEVLFVVVFGGAFTSKMVVRYGLWALALVGLVLVQSRGSLLAAVLLITVVTLAGMRSRSVIAIAVACTIGVMLDVFVFETRLSSAAQNFVAEDVLLLNSPYRGLGTGASGRDVAVAFALELVVEHPLAGVGFGRSGASEVKDMSIVSLDNGYLALLAELGAPLFAIPAILIIGAAWLSVARKDWAILGMIFSFVFSFLVWSPRAINMSLPTMLFWAFVARSWILPLRSRHADTRGGS